MAEQKGWTFSKHRSGWIGRVWRPTKQPRAGYVSKTFDTWQEAKEWAKTEAANIQIRDTHEDGLITKKLVVDFLAEMKRLGRSAQYIKDTTYILKGADEDWREKGKRTHPPYRVAVPDLGAPCAGDETKAWLSERTDLAPATRNKYLVTVKALAHWAIAMKRLKASPFKAIKKEKLPDFTKDQFALDELRLLLGRFGDPYHLRFALMVYTGMRVDEAATIDCSAFDIPGKIATVFGKGQKERMVPLPDEFLAILSTYAMGSGPMFKPKALLGREFAQFLTRSGIKRGGRTPHSTRHCYAGLMTATGVPTALLAAYMGHASQQTTMGYAKMATRYVAGVEDWRRGQFEFMTGAVTEWRCEVKRRSEAA